MNYDNKFDKIISRQAYTLTKELLGDCPDNKYIELCSILIENMNTLGKITGDDVTSNRFTIILLECQDALKNLIAYCDSNNYKLNENMDNLIALFISQKAQIFKIQDNLNWAIEHQDILFQCSFFREQCTYPAFEIPRTKKNSEFIDNCYDAQNDHDEINDFFQARLIIALVHEDVDEMLYVLTKYPDKRIDYYRLYLNMKEKLAYVPTNDAEKRMLVLLNYFANPQSLLDADTKNIDTDTLLKYIELAKQGIKVWTKALDDEYIFPEDEIELKKKIKSAKALLQQLEELEKSTQKLKLKSKLSGISRDKYKKTSKTLVSQSTENKITRRTRTLKDNKNNLAN